MNITKDWLEFAADELSTNNYAIIDNFLSAEEVRNIREVFEFHREQENFKKAGIGQHDDFQLVSEIRGDYIKWIDKETALPATKLYLEKINSLKDYLNQTCYLGIRDYECHFTIYPPKSFYKRHLDQFKGDGSRKISFICYLNENWQPGDGGELRVYLKDGVLDVTPTAGKLACFRSELVEHEVLLSQKHRYSLTGWMLNRPIGLGFIVD